MYKFRFLIAFLLFPLTGLACGVTITVPNATPSTATVTACLDDAAPYGECTTDDSGIEGFGVVNTLPNGTDIPMSTGTDGTVSFSIRGKTQLNLSWDPKQIVKIGGVETEICPPHKPTSIWVWQDNSGIGVDFAVPVNSCQGVGPETEDAWNWIWSPVLASN